MIREGAEIRTAHAPHAGPGSGIARAQSVGPLTVMKAVVTGGSLATRLLISGALLLVGLPVLTILVYLWGSPPTPAPIPLLVLVDSLQVLIVLNALVVVGQLLVGVRRRSSLADSRMPDARVSWAGVSVDRPKSLQELCVELTEMIWEHERHARSGLDHAVLAYVRDAVTVEVERRRRRVVLDQRLAELESMF
jgi:hypothetical protein